MRRKDLSNLRLIIEDFRDNNHQSQIINSEMKLTNPFNFLNPFKESAFLGVDIGTSSIKVVQLSPDKKTYKLDTYGEIKLFSKGTEKKFAEESFKILDDDVAETLKKIIAESGVKAKKTAMSVPVYASFSTIIEMPDLPRGDLEKAIEFQARQYIPVPIDQVSLNSLIVERIPSQNGEQSKLLVMLIAVPNEVKKKYENIARLAGLSLVALEMETFPLARTLNKGAKDVFLIIDIGAKSTNYCVVDGGFVRLSHNYDISGVAITEAYEDFLREDHTKAENMKKAMGLKMTPGQMDNARGVLAVVNSIAAEAERIMSVYFNKSAKRIQKIILSGGSANMPGLSEYFSERLNIPVSIADPFSEMVYPKELEGVIKEIGPSFAVATGLAMRR